MGSIKTHQNQPKAAQTSPKQPKLFKNHLKCNFYTLNPSQKLFRCILGSIKPDQNQPKAAQSSPKQPKVAQSSPK